MGSGLSLPVGIWAIEMLVCYVAGTGADTVATENVSLSSSTGAIALGQNQALTMVSFSTGNLTRQIKYSTILRVALTTTYYAVLRLDQATTGGFTTGATTSQYFSATRIA
jgi:hypothetical protein